MDRRYYLAKTDPETYSVERFATDGETTWDGVRNPQAQKAIRGMHLQDRVFIYHSMKEAAVVGLAEVTSEPYDDPKEPKLAVVKMRFLFRLETPVSLKEIKQSGLFSEWSLVRQSRLSTMEAPQEFVTWIRHRAPAQNI